MKCRFFYMAFIIFAFLSMIANAKVYVNESFEQFASSDDIAKKSDLWEITEPQDNPVGGGIASSEQAHSGKISALFDDARCMGFALKNLGLSDSYAVSTWFYHDSKQAPPPDAVVIMIPDAYPGGGNFWIGIGTRTQAVKLENYSYRDKTGTGIYEDTNVPRRTEWVQFIFVVQPKATDFYVDGKKVYTAKIDSVRYNGYQMSRTPPWGIQTGKVFIDDVIIADKVDEIATTQSVTIDKNKLAITWGKIKMQRRRPACINS